MGQLKIVKIGKKRYFLDLRLVEIRNVKNPHDFVRLTALDAYLLSKTN